MANSNKYDSSSIQVLKGLESVRKRPGMYIGSTGCDGLHQLLCEVVDNSVDEHVSGHARFICVTLDEKKNKITVEDDGRGIPVDHHEGENKSALELVLTTIHAGGKFDDKTYTNSSGLHGVGLSAVNALSSDLRVTVHREGRVYFQHYVRGVPQTSVEDVNTTDTNGTIIEFVPDTQIFKRLKFQAEKIKSRLIELAYLNSKLIIFFKVGDQRERFHYKNGLKDYVGFLNQDEQVLHKPMRIFKKTKEYAFELMFQYNNSYKDNARSFANNINTVEGGTHLNAVRAASIGCLIS